MKPKKIRIKLKPIDLSKAKGTECPGIDDTGKKEYLCLIGKRFFVGGFNRQWYGLFFDGWHDVGHQFDAPGTNGSEWKAVWEIVNESGRR